jgi:hypothetical protein
MHVETAGAVLSDQTIEHISEVPACVFIEGYYDETSVSSILRVLSCVRTWY